MVLLSIVFQFPSMIGDDVSRRESTCSLHWVLLEQWGESMNFSFGFTPTSFIEIVN